MPSSNPIYRIGCGAGFSSDRLDPAVDLARRGKLHCLVFECIGERTLAFGHRERRVDPTRGYNPLLAHRMRAVLPACRDNNTKIVTNMGVANPQGAAEVVIGVARELGLNGLRVAVVTGDDVSDGLSGDTMLWEGMTIDEAGREYIGANVYLGADAIRPAVADAEVIITGRVADPSLFLAPLAHHFDWQEDDWNRLAAGTSVGHLLECAGQITGGYFADPGYKNVNDLAWIGFPLAEVSDDGDAVITKLSETGGKVDLHTVKEQLIYEVHDPGRYYTPDVIADFSTVSLHEQGADRVHVSGATAAGRPEALKVTVAFDGGFLAEAGVSYAGPGAQKRAELAGDVVRERLLRLHGSNAPLRIDLIGAASLHAANVKYADESEDIRLRCALRASSREEAEVLLWEVESLLTCGPAGGGGYRGNVTPSVITYSASIAREQVSTDVQVLVA